MSLHRYIVPPPLALAVHPAPPPKKPEPKDKEKDKSKEKEDKDKENGAKDDDKGRKEEKKDKNEKKEKNEKDDKDDTAEKTAADVKDGKDVADNAKLEAQAQDQGQGGKKGKKGKKGDKSGPPTRIDVEAKVAATAPADNAQGGMPPTPMTPTSMVPEPPTPATLQPNQADVPGPKTPSPKGGEDNQAKASSPAKAGSRETDENKADAPEAPLSPLPSLRLLSPAPHRPLRAKLDLDPSRPYPPIATDPRGAYHKYAKAVQGQKIYVDVTKDGWLVEQWREKPEREALERLSGESERRRMREVEAAKKSRVVRKVPETAEGLIKELWNDLVEAPNNWILVDEFWARYDWNDPAAQIHLQERNINEASTPTQADGVMAKSNADAADPGASDDSTGGPEKTGSKGLESSDHNKAEENKRSKSEEGVKKEKADTPVDYGLEVETEWTKEGVEDVLSTVGVQCGYNTEKPLPRHWSSPSGGYLLLSHGHFLLRIEQDIQFKPANAVNEFEVLVTSGHDRVFGEMVKAQQAEERKKKEKEYRERKEREYRERKERERREGKKDKDKEGEQEKARADKGDKVNEGAKVDKADDIKHKNGNPVRLSTDAVAVQVEGEDAVAVVAVPVPPKAEEGKAKEKVKEEKTKEEKRDELHEAEPRIVVADEKEKKDGAVEKEGSLPNDDGKNAEAPKDNKNQEAKEKDKDKDEDKEKDKEKHKEKDKEKGKPTKHPHAPPGFDPRDIALLANLLGPEVANLPMSELKAAFAAVEAAAHASNTKHAEMKKDPNAPVIWTWNEPVEIWRWKNFAAECAVLEEGCWEERDWVVFADDRGCEEYEIDQAWAEESEIDVHDWSC